MMIEFELLLPDDFSGACVKASGPIGAEVAVHSARFGYWCRCCPAIEPMNGVGMRNIKQFCFPEIFSRIPIITGGAQRNVFGCLHVIPSDIRADNALLDGSGGPDAAAQENR